MYPNTDIDECELEDSCKYGVCINRPGSYICQCPPGFDLNPAGNGCIGKWAYILDIMAKLFS